MTILRISFVAVFVALFPLIAVHDDLTNAQDGFFSGKTVRIVVGSSPGGGYDYWARLLARHMPKYLPGNPEVVVQNMPGGGSLVATNYVYSVAKPDGLTVGMPNQLVYMGQVVGDKEARFDMQKFNWIGSPDRNPTVLFIRADTPYKSIDDVIKAKIPPKCGGSGRDSSSMIFALEDLVGAKFDVVLGYQGGVKPILPLKGEKLSAAPWASEHISAGNLLRSGIVKILIGISFKPGASGTTGPRMPPPSMNSWIAIRRRIWGADWRAF
jgi:tripartite-type tricarboxylate transporter receptor subunit TctC